MNEVEEWVVVKRAWVVVLSVENRLINKLINLLKFFYFWRVTERDTRQKEKKTREQKRIYLRKSTKNV